MKTLIAPDIQLISAKSPRRSAFIFFIEYSRDRFGYFVVTWDSVSMRIH
jgi:hypothetical protein